MKVNYSEDLDEIWTVKEVCEYLKIEKKKAYKLFKISTFPAVKLGNEYRVPKRLFQKWFIENLGKIVHI